MALWNVGDKWNETDYALVDKRDNRIVEGRGAEGYSPVPRGYKVVCVHTACEITGKRWSRIEGQDLPIITRVITVEGKTVVNMGDKGTFVL